MIRPALLSLLLSLFLSQASHAQSCTFLATDINFGVVDSLGSGATDVSGTLTINCSAFLLLVSSINMSISLGEGLGGFSGGSRRMTSLSTATPLAYQLYKDAGRSQVWGSTYTSVGGTPLSLSSGTLLGLLSSGSVQVPIYGRVLAGQNGVVPGTYGSVFSRNPLDVRVDYQTCNVILVCTNRNATFSFAALARVDPDCRVVAGDLDFGATGVLSGSIVATSTISVTCTAQSAFQIGLDYGFHGTGQGDRNMQDIAGNQVFYDLYRDPSRTLLWGMIADGTTQPGTGSGSGQSFTVHGRVPSQPTPPPGAYSDSVGVTVTY